MSTRHWKKLLHLAIQEEWIIQMHDAKTSIYRINVFNFINSQFICTVFLYSTQHKQPKPI